MQSPGPSGNQPGGPLRDPHRGAGSAYAAFLAAVTAAQLTGWLPTRPSRVLDLSTDGGGAAAVIAEAGHTVVRLQRGDGCGRSRAAGRRLHAVRGDPRESTCLADESVDAIVAEGNALSHCLVTEDAVSRLTRSLRRGGRLLLRVDSLLYGLAELAEQGRWAELADAPAADVVLVPHPDGSLTRCFWPDELRDLLSAVGLTVEWVRPRSVLPEQAVAAALQAEPELLDRLVASELQLERERAEESVGVSLVASVRRP